MRKIHLLGLALVAMLAFSALIASAASALTFVLAEWLINGLAVSSEQPSEGKGELELRDESFGAMECSGILDGTIGPNSLDLVTAVLNLEKTATITLTAPLLCKAVSSCENSTTDVEASPVGLPWPTEVELSEPDGTAWELIFGAAYETSCLVFGIKLTDECSLATGEAEAKNVAGGVELAEAVSPNGNCSLGGTGSGVLKTLPGNLITSTSGTVSISK